MCRSSLLGIFACRRGSAIGLKRMIRMSRSQSCRKRVRCHGTVLRSHRVADLIPYSTPVTRGELLLGGFGKKKVSRPQVRCPCGWCATLASSRHCLGR
jgi:hypothetical protein